MRPISSHNNTYELREKFILCNDEKKKLSNESTRFLVELDVRKNSSVNYVKEEFHARGSVCEISEKHPNDEILNNSFITKQIYFPPPHDISRNLKPVQYDESLIIDEKRWERSGAEGGDSE